MKNKLFPIALFLSALMMASCGPGATADETSATPATPKNSALLGEVFNSRGGGYSLQKIKGYDFKESFGFINMFAPGADPRLGPGIVAIGGLNNTDSTNQQLLEKIKRDSPTFKYSNEKNIKVGGRNGLSVDVEGTEGSQAIKGTIVLVMATPKQQFNLIGIAPGEHWAEVAPIFDAVLSSVSFFQADPSAYETPVVSPTAAP